MLFDLRGLKRASRCVLDFATLPCLESRSLYIPFSSKLWKSVVAHTICISHGCSSNFQTIRAPCRKYGRGKLIPVFNPAHQYHSNIRFGTSVFEHQEMEKTCTMALQPQKQMSRNSSLVVLFVTQAVFPSSIHWV